jgi:hypothetical protein
MAMADEVTWSGGKLVHGKVKDKVNSTIEKGIEIVGSFDVKGQSYETVTNDQNASLAWLIQALETKLSLSDDDV